jgi:hypothetical protein
MRSAGDSARSAGLVDIQSRGTVEMLDHRFLGGVGISRGHAFDDFLVLFEGQILLAGPNQHLGVLFFQPAEHGFADSLEKRISGNRGDLRVQPHIRGDEGVRIA